MNLEALKNRDYTLIVDKSGSMGMYTDTPSGKSRWQYAQETALGLAAKMHEYDPDGITVYTFNDRFKRYDNVTPEKVAQIWAENDPTSGTDLALVLRDSIDNFFYRRDRGQTKVGETFLVITDGEPNDRDAVINTIVSATKKMNADEELAISFVQIGRDGGAQTFLKKLDDGLTALGAKFDIVDTVTSEELADRSLTDVLWSAITD